MVVDRPSCNQYTRAENDFIFLMNLINFSNQDEQCSRAANNAMKNHFWYLNEEVVGLSLFSSNVEDIIKNCQKALECGEKSEAD